MSAEKNYYNIYPDLGFLPNEVFDYIKELEEQKQILTKELKVIYYSNNESYYDYDRIKILLKGLGEDIKDD